MNTGGWDLVVIGGGIAGTSAALEAAAAGARVLVVRSGPGATALCSGGWWGPLPDRLGELLASSGLRYQAVAAPLVHVNGDVRACPHAGASHARAFVEDRTLLVGIAGLPGFHPQALARMFGAVGHVLLTVDGTPAAGWSPVSLAARLDGAPRLLRKPLASLRGATRVILPPVLGLERHEAVMAALADLPFEVAEALGTTPSVPGWRLDHALRRGLAAAGVAVETGQVMGRKARGDRLEAVVTAQAGGTRELAADRFVLATGRFVGGGITAADVTDAVDVARGGALRQAALMERALGCEVWIDHLGERFTQVQPVPLTVPRRVEPQPLLGAGVHVDDQGRPLSWGGQVQYSNVVARGAVVSGRPHGLGHAAEALS